MHWESQPISIRKITPLLECWQNVFDLYYERNPNVSLKIILKPGCYVPSFEQVVLNTPADPERNGTNAPPREKSEFYAQPPCASLHESQNATALNLQVKQNNLTPNNTINEPAGDNSSLSAPDMTSIEPDSSHNSEHAAHVENDREQAHACAESAMPQRHLPEIPNDTEIEQQASLFQPGYFRPNRWFYAVRMALWH